MPDADLLRSLHVPGKPIVLPNAWDAASAKVIEAAGFPALATTSGGVAAALGYEDHEGAPVEDMFAAAGRISGSVEIPVTVDAEAGYGMEPAELVAALLDAGASGCNLEDTDNATDTLRDPAEHAEWLRRVREAAGDSLVINARVDTFIAPFRAGTHDGRQGELVADALERANAYVEAGADCVYPILLWEAEPLRAFLAEAPGPGQRPRPPQRPLDRRARRARSRPRHLRQQPPGADDAGVRRPARVAQALTAGTDGSLIYSMTVSLDGYIAGPDGDIDWSAPDAELHRFHNERVRGVGVQLLGRRLYETMVYWETAEERGGLDEPALEFARIWKELPKVVFSTTLESVEGNARLVREGAVEEAARLKEESTADLAVGGAGLAGSLIEAGLVDEFRLFVVPVVVGGGTPFFPALEKPIDLELVETRNFDSPALYLRYQLRR